LRRKLMTKVKQTGTPVKHIPIRTCIACRKTGNKREFIRLFCLPDGPVEVDSSGKKTGRGSYLCADVKCWEEAVKTGKIEHALRTKLTAENKEKLVNYIKGFNNTNSNA
jgi:uncharacterized protein